MATRLWVDPTEVRMGDLVEANGKHLEVLAVLHGVAGVTLYLEDDSESFYPKGAWTYVAIIMTEGARW